MLSIDNMNPVPQPKSYADNNIIETCIELAYKKKKCYVLTNDLDLTIRLAGNNYLPQKFCTPIMVYPTKFAKPKNLSNFTPDLSGFNNN